MLEHLPHLSLLVALPVLLGCGSTFYQPGRTVGLDPQDPRHIDDEAIRLALDSRPQMPASIQVAYFNLAPERDPHIEAMLDGVESVSGVYRIPPLMVTGQRRFDPQSVHGSPQAVSMRKLRLLAARAQCDVLLVFDYGYRVTQSPNGWAALTPLIVPVFFAPFIDTEAESYLDAYIVDTRNGYLYAQLGESLAEQEDAATIWDDPGEELIETQWATLVEATGAKLGQVVAEQTAQARATP